ncbi:SH3 domain-containing protein [Streptomyces sp. TRM 70351]|uniref:SH3 domain-containing protein n=1 Tax=Streptomyces sp. TRM 70351 TaxID=3116552 RepID=UPI002E7C550D|nr:SH3 domain-containing protein [Streptomyces sp. TRM 70351]MEE1927527.1 SH3 domain-containing protein [Streptomyces sp. TRM 70351]
MAAIRAAGAVRRRLRATVGVAGAAVAAVTLMPQPAAAHPPSATAHIWATDVRVRNCQSTSCDLATQERLSRVTVKAYCQLDAGERGRVTDGRYTNTYWVQVITPGKRLGWVSAVYVSGGSNNGPVPGVPVDSLNDPTIDCEYI